MVKPIEEVNTIEETTNVVFFSDKGDEEEDKYS